MPSQIDDGATIERISVYLKAAPARDPQLEHAQLCARLVALGNLVTSLATNVQSESELRKETDELVKPCYRKALSTAVDGSTKVSSEDKRLGSECERLRREVVRVLGAVDTSGASGQLSREAKDGLSKLALALVCFFEDKYIAAADHV